MRAWLVTVVFFAVAVAVAATPAAASTFPPHPLTIDLPAEGQRAIDGLSDPVSAGGDVNGDGVPDVLIAGSSTVYVIFGPLGDSPVDPAALGERGFVVQGRPTDSSFVVDAAGDVNGDGLGDIIIGAANPCDQPNAAFVVFGKHDTAPVDLANLAGAGFRIDGTETPKPAGECVGGPAGMLVSGAGDFNADGRADVILAEDFVDGVWVVFGKSDSDPVAVDSLGSGGTSFDVPMPHALDGGLDANGDGTADVVVSGEVGYGLTPSYARVLFGGADANIERGFSITGRSFWLNARYQDSVADRLGDSVAMIGDLNGDGLAEVALGAPYAPSLDYVPPPPTHEDGQIWETNFGGAVFVVFGRRSTAAVDPYELGDGGYRVGGDGDRAVGHASSFGGMVSRAGDINGDGLDDIAIVSGSAYPSDASFGWVVFGKGDAAPQAVTARSRATDVPSQYLEVVLVPEPGSSALVGVGDQTGDGRVDLLMGGSLVTEPPPPLLPGPCANVVPIDSQVGFGYGRLVYATNAGDEMRGGPGRDRAYALLGEDCMFGVGEADELYGGGGDDMLQGGDGADSLDGGPGADRLVGGVSGDELAGGAGGDRIDGRGSPDRLIGGRGPDRLLGRTGGDNLRGGRGHDVLIGNAGEDRINAVDGVRDVVRCGVGSFFRDYALVDVVDRVTDCEIVRRFPKR